MKKECDNCYYAEFYEPEQDQLMCMANPPVVYFTGGFEARSVRPLVLPTAYCRLWTKIGDE